MTTKDKILELLDATDRQGIDGAASPTTPSTSTPPPCASAPPPSASTPPSRPTSPRTACHLHPPQAPHPVGPPCGHHQPCRGTQGKHHHPDPSPPIPRHQQQPHPNHPPITLRHLVRLPGIETHASLQMGQATPNRLPYTKTLFPTIPWAQRFPAIALF